MKKLLISLAVLIITSSCTHRNVTNEPVQNNVIAEFSFMTREDFAMYLYSNLHDSKNWGSRSINHKIKAARDYAIYRKYMYVSPDGEFNGDRLLTWMDFVMFLGAFYNRLPYKKGAVLPPLKEYSYMKKLFSILVGNGLLKYRELVNFKGNFPIPESIIEERIQKLNRLINEN